jgi:hypothetical protein
MHAIYGFKAMKIEDRIDEIRLRFNDENLETEEMMELLAEQMAYENAKMKIAEKLGRIILR